MKKKRKKSISMFLVCVILFSIFSYTKIITEAVSNNISYATDIISTGLNQAVNVVEGPDGKLYISEYGGGNIYKVDKNGQNKEVFASGLNQPIGMVFDSAGNLYVAQHSGAKVEKITPSGVKTQVKSGTGILTGIAIDSNDKIYFAEYGTGKIFKMNLDGTGFVEFKTGLGTNTMIGMTIDSSNNLYVSDRSGGKIKKIDPSANVTDFISGLNTPTWITLGEDGYFYTSLGSRLIEKYDTSGTKVDSFITPSTVGYPWGTSIDQTGYIYFETLGSVCKLIIGKAITLDKKHIELDLNTSMSNTSADPSAFIVDGVSSNPQVTNVVVSGSKIILTLSTDISYTDSSMKISYQKTGTDNLVKSGSASELESFSNIPVTNNVLRITNIGSIPQVNVAYGTTLSAITLPSTVAVSLSNSTTTTSAVTWDSGEPSYSENVAGTYVFKGTVELGENTSNPLNLQANLNIVVGTPSLPNIDSIQNLSNISVSNGTAINSIGLPSTVNVNLSNSVTTTAAVTWDNGTPSYNSTVAGTYIFSGAIDSSSEFSNPGNLKALINITVQSKSSSSSSSGGSTPAPANDNTIIKVNGENHAIGNETKVKENGLETVNVKVNHSAIDTILENIQNDLSGSNRVEVNVNNSSSQVAVIGLTGDIVKKLDQNSFDVLINKGKTSYNIPAKELTVDAVANKLGINQENLKDINFEIKIKETTEENQKVMVQTIEGKNTAVIVVPTEFIIVAKTTKMDGSTEDFEINTFTQYVERVFEIPEGIKLEDITTGIVFDSDMKTYEHVPTNIFIKDGKAFAKVNSLTNSTYSVISNPIKVENAKGHWAENTINNMASRMIIIDYKNLKPDQDVTRAELADYIVRALGLHRSDTQVTSKFSDVSKEDKNAIAITIASDWGIINGYEDLTFRPNAKISREEAMVMYSKMLEIGKFKNSEQKFDEDILSKQGVSKWAIPFVKESLNAKIFVGRSSESMDFKSNMTHAESLEALKNILTNLDLINK